MSTAALCGMNGSITGATGATEISYWEITQTIDVPDATSFTSVGWKERVPCLKGATGNFKSIGASSTIGAHAGCVFKDALAGYTISGSIIISKITISTPVDGIVSFNHDFSITGTFTAA